MLNHGVARIPLAEVEASLTDKEVVLIKIGALNNGVSSSL